MSGLIGAAFGAAGSIAGGVMAGGAIRKARRMLKEQKKENKEWYDMRYNENATERVEAQATMRKLEDMVRERNRSAAAAQAVAGGTDASLAATRAANNEATAGVMSSIVQQGEARKDAIENQYRERAAALDSQLVDMEIARGQNLQQAAQGVGQAFGNANYGSMNIGGKEIAL